MALGPATAPGTTTRTQPFGPAIPNAPGYFSQPEMYGSGNVVAYWQPYKGWDKFPHYHNGIDEAGGEGTSLLAMETGKVISAGWRDNGGGYVIEVEIRQGTTYSFAHCLGTGLASVGSIVKKGQAIARIGSTGVATGNHCHITLEIREQDKFGVGRTLLWNPVLWMAGGPYANDARIHSAYVAPAPGAGIVKFNTGVDGVNGRTAPDSRLNNVYAVAFKDPKGIVRLSDNKKIGNTSSQRKLYRVVRGPDGFDYNELQIHGTGRRTFWQSRFMHRV